MNADPVNDDPLGAEVDAGPDVEVDLEGFEFNSTAPAAPRQPLLHESFDSERHQSYRPGYNAWDNPEQKEPDKPDLRTAGEKFDDAFSSVSSGLLLESSVASAIHMPSKPAFRDQPGYNAILDSDLRGYDVENFDDSKSAEETEWRKTRIDYERRLAEDAGVGGRIAGALLSPTPWVAGGVVLAGSVGNLVRAGAVGATRAAVTGAALTTGHSMKSIMPAATKGLGMSRLGAAGVEVAAEGTSEALLHSEQFTRTWQDSGLNIAAAGTAAALLGGYAKELTPAELKAAQDNVAVDLRGVVDDTANGGGPKSMGAAETGEGMADVNMPGLVDWVGFGPGKRLATAASRKATALYRNLVDSPFDFKDSATKPTPQPSIESLRGQFEGQRIQSMEFESNQYSAYRKGAGNRMNRAQFSEAVAQAMRRGDVSSIPEVAATAKQWRKQVDALLKRGADAGIPELKAALKAGGPKFAKSYFPRMYDPTKRGELENALEAHFYEQKMAATKTTRTPEQAGAEAAADARAVVVAMTDHGAPSPAGTVIIPGAAGAKPRTLAVKDSVLEPFLVNDTQVLGQHLRQLGTEVLMTERFGKRAVTDEISEISTDYANMIADAAKAGDTKLAKKLTKEKNTILADLRALEGRLHGTFGRPADPTMPLVRAGRVLRSLTGAAYLGGVVLSSLPDVVRPLFQQGFKQYAKGLAALVDVKRFKLTKNEMRRIGVGGDLWNGQRLRAVADFDDQMSKWENQMMQAVGRGTGLSYWAAGLKTWTGAMASDAIMEWSEQLAKGTLSKARAQKLRRVGIDEAMAKQIVEQFQRHGDKQGALRLAESGLWDKDVAEVYEAAVRNEVNMTMLEPGLGDRPLIMSNEVGKLVMQFQSFGMSSVNRGLIAGLSRADADFYAAISLSIAVGALSTTTKDALRGRDATEDPQRLLWDAIDRSGIAGTWMMLLTQAKAVNGDRPSRSLGKGMAGKMVGPGVGGIIPGALEATIKTARGDGEARDFIKLMPFNNVAHVRDILERANMVPYHVPDYVKNPKPLN